MRVTFTFASYVEDPQFGTVLMHGVNCRHTCPQPAECEDWDIYRICDHSVAAQDACGCQVFDVNAANVNAKMILERLGLPSDPDDEGDLAGHIDPDDLIARAMLGNIGMDDSGTDDVDMSVPGSARFICCGVPAGYFEEKFAALITLATEAKRRDVLVGWC